MVCHASTRARAWNPTAGRRARRGRVHSLTRVRGRVASRRAQGPTATSPHCLRSTIRPRTPPKRVSLRCLPPDRLSACAQMQHRDVFFFLKRTRRHAVSSQIRDNRLAPGEACRLYLPPEARWVRAAVRRSKMTTSCRHAHWPIRAIDRLRHCH